MVVRARSRWEHRLAVHDEAQPVVAPSVVDAGDLLPRVVRVVDRARQEVVRALFLPLLLLPLPPDIGAEHVHVGERRRALQRDRDCFLELETAHAPCPMLRIRPPSMKMVVPVT